MITEYCIVIPIYKAELDCVEEISLRRLRKILIDDKMNVGIWHEYEDYSPVYLVCQAIPSFEVAICDDKGSSIGIA